jgi:ArsR family transcriptional regulator
MDARMTLTVVKTGSDIRAVSRLLRALGQPVRLQILLAIGEGEACVCHLESTLGRRQAYISQHLMALRKAKLLTGRRAGRFVYYRLRQPQLLDLIHQAGMLSGVAPELLGQGPGGSRDHECACPNCAGPVLPEEGQSAPADLNLGDPSAGSTTVK